MLKVGIMMPINMRINVPSPHAHPTRWREKKKRNMQLHALDRDDGSVVWSQDTGGQLVQTYQNQSLFAGSLVVPSLSGDIFFYRAGWSGERGGTHARTNQGTRAQTNARAHKPTSRSQRLLTPV